MPLKANIPESETKPEEPEEPKKEKAEVKITKAKGTPPTPKGDDTAPSGATEKGAVEPIPLGKKKKGLGFPLFDDIANAFSKDK